MHLYFYNGFGTTLIYFIFSYSLMLIILLPMN